MSALTVCLNVANRLSPRSARCAITIPLRFKGRFKPFEEQEVPIRPTMLKPKKRIRVFIWGGTLSGALGRNKFVRPELKLREAVVKEFRDYPSKLGFSEWHNVKDVACGHGFTILAARHEERINDYELFGTGINTDSQIGVQMASNKVPMRLLTEPVPISFPTHENGERVHINEVAAGRAHTVVRTDNGCVYGLGNNSLGQCGRKIDPDETYFGKDLLHKIRIPETVSKIVCGLDHTLFLTKTGEVYACGWGADGQTGLGHYRNTGVPEKVRGDIEGVPIVELASRGDCVLAVNSSGDVFGWGNNEYGQLLGERGESQRHTPKHIRFNKPIRKVAAGGSSCLALDDDGIVYSWGYGILGLGPEVESCTVPKPIPPALLGRNDITPQSRVVELVSGLNHFAALDNGGNLYTWGRNQNGCLGLGIGTEPYQMFPLKVNISAMVKKASIGIDHMAVMTESFC